MSYPAIFIVNSDPQSISSNVVSLYLGLSIRHCCQDDAGCEHDYAKNYNPVSNDIKLHLSMISYHTFHVCISFSPYIANKHSHHAATTAEDDVHGD